MSKASITALVDKLAGCMRPFGIDAKPDTGVDFIITANALSAVVSFACIGNQRP